MQTQANEHSRFKIAQLWHITTRPALPNQITRKSYSHKQIVHEILKEDFDINCKVTVVPDIKLKSRIHLKDCTALHFVFCDNEDIDTFATLLDRGADYTIKNGNGQTVLHLIISTSDQFMNPNVPFLNLVLSSHIKHQNSTNPHDNNGVSHLHGACIANHVEAVNLFLDNGATIDEAVNINSNHFAGYTPLHFAVENCSLQVVQLVIDRGANINVKNAKGKSPLDMLMDKEFKCGFVNKNKLNIEQILKLLLEKGAVSGIGLSNLHIACTLKDLAIAEQLLNEDLDINYAVPMNSKVRPGFTALHFAANTNIEAVKMILKHGAQIDIMNAHGKTALDVCLDEYNVDDMCNILSCIVGLKELCLSDGETKLLDLIASMKNPDAFKSFLEDKVKNINAIVPNDSIIWPGYTILHLAVTFSDKIGFDMDDRRKKNDQSIVQECLKRGLSVNVQDIKGKTPIHIAFNQSKGNVASLLFKQLKKHEALTNIIDEDNLSYLHIACALKDQSLVERLLEISEANISYTGKNFNDRNVGPGSTPLHIVAANGSHIIAEILLKHGANLHVVDKSGMTPIHWLIFNDMMTGMLGDQPINNVLFTYLSDNLDQNKAFVLNSDYLHIACRLGYLEVVQKLLDFGVNVNAILKFDEDSDDFITNSARCMIGPYSNFTPLHMALQTIRPSEQIIELLIRRGADMFVESLKVGSKYEKCNPIENRNAVRCFFRVLWDQDDIQKQIEEKFGLTKLHVACYLKDEDLIKTALDMKIDVNAQLKEDSMIFAKCTPLHLLLATVISQDFLDIQFVQFPVAGMVKLLIDRGADVTIINADEETPIHVFHTHGIRFEDGDNCKAILLDAHQNFSVNPTNAKGFSHFHLAALWCQPDHVEKFLQQGYVDINRPIDYFEKMYGGCTPLLLTLSSYVPADGDWTKPLQTVDILLKYGADVAAKDVNGDTCLHKHNVFYSPELTLLDKLISFGADIKSKNVRCQTPIEVCPDILRRGTDSPTIVKIFEKYGCKINSWNELTGEGNIAKVFLSNAQGNLCENTEFEKFMKSSDVRVMDDLRRTSIHNAVAVSKERHFPQDLGDYIYAIESFIKIGIDIDHQDKSGQTALHYAARMGNVNGVKALLACGADFNITDNRGKSAFSHAKEHSTSVRQDIFNTREKAETILNLHTKKLQFLRIEVSQLNESFIEEKQSDLSMLMTMFKRGGGDRNKLPKNFVSQVEMAKSLDIGTNSLTLYDFLSETGAVYSYCLLSKSERDIVDHFFENIDYNKFEELKGIIRLQLRKMRTRLSLIDSALNSLRRLLGFSVPNLCENISLYLSISDLKNLIESTALKTKKRKISEISS